MQKACSIFKRDIFWDSSIPSKQLSNILIDDIDIANLDCGGNNAFIADLNGQECTLHLEGCVIIDVEYN